MKIWFDILTPKQLLFFEPLIKRLNKRHKVICTSRNYREVTNLAKKRGTDLKILGKHGGALKEGKLVASISRMSKLASLMSKESPDLVISFCSPDASRIAFGLGIRHYAFCDAPHAEAVMRLSIPLIQKLFIPWIIPKSEFTKYGISQKNIIQYRSIDAAIIIKEKSIKSNIHTYFNNKKKLILFRPYEAHAAYAQGKTIETISIIKKIAKEFPNCNLLVLGRYSDQISQLKSKLGKNVIILDKIVDSGEILSLTDVFVGSGGTMTAESALRGIPTISYDAIPNIIEDYLVSRNLIKRCKSPLEIIKQTKKFLSMDKNKIRKKAFNEFQKMEDPFTVFLQALNDDTE